jgi:hypothetical protein
MRNDISFDIRVFATDIARTNPPLSRRPTTRLCHPFPSTDVDDTLLRKQQAYRKLPARLLLSQSSIDTGGGFQIDRTIP